MNKEKSFSLESIQDRETICKYLQVFKEGFEQGVINFAHKDTVFNLEPQGLIKLEIRAGLEGKEVMLNISFRWTENKSSIHDSDPEEAGFLADQKK